MIATRDIAPGEIILSEAAILIYSDEDIALGWYFSRRLERAVEALDPAVKARFMDLHCSPLNEIIGPVRGRYNTNCIGTEALGSSILLEGSMFNHSCKPNMVCKERDSSLTMDFRALREIHEGEELTYSYAPHLDLLPKVVRQDQLDAIYDFTCGCSVCTLTGSESAADDARRREIAAFIALADKRQFDQANCKLVLAEVNYSILRRFNVAACR